MKTYFKVLTGAVILLAGFVGCDGGETTQQPTDVSPPSPVEQTRSIDFTSKVGYEETLRETLRVGMTVEWLHQHLSVDAEDRLVVSAEASEALAFPPAQPDLVEPEEAEGPGLKPLAGGGSCPFSTSCFPLPTGLSFASNWASQYHTRCLYRTWNNSSVWGNSTPDAPNACKNCCPGNTPCSGAYQGVGLSPLGKCFP